MVLLNRCVMFAAMCVVLINRCVILVARCDVSCQICDPYYNLFGVDSQVCVVNCQVNGDGLEWLE